MDSRNQREGEGPNDLRLQGLDVSVHLLEGFPSSRITAQVVLLGVPAPPAANPRWRIHLPHLVPDRVHTRVARCLLDADHCWPFSVGWKMYD